MRYPSRLAQVCLVTALSGAALQATDLIIGLQASIMAPMGDLSAFTGTSTGFGAGAHLLLDLGGGHTLRPRLDFGSFPGKPGYYKFQQFSGGADYVYFTEKRATEGFYLAAGVGMASNLYDTNFQPAYSRSYSNPYLALGAGYQINAAWGLEVRYQTSRFTDADGVTSNVNNLGVAATVRFKGLSAR
jgi:hypothetical protein